MANVCESYRICRQINKLENIKMKETIFELYKNISIGKNEICNKCNETEAKGWPVSFYFAGDKFKKGEDTILFVGKTAVGDSFEPKYAGDFQNDLFCDATKFGEASLDLIEDWATGRHFYNYTHAIIEKYYGSYKKGKDYVALTNIVKCNNGSTNDTTPYLVKEYCINQLGVIWKEIELLSPKRVVFYTNKYYDDFIDAYRPKNFVNYEDITDKNKRIEIANRTTPWWHRRFIDENKEIICDFLRLGHPQRMSKSDYVETVFKWLNDTK